MMRHQKTKGSIIVALLVLTTVFVVMATGLLSVIVAQKKLALAREAQLLSLQIAEAGINYYKWHLDNFPENYTDGNDNSLCDPNPPYTCGPYIHNYDDPSGSTIGQFELFITPPENGSTIVKIRSTGWSMANPNIKRTIAARYGRPSWAQYSVIANADIRFGEGTVVHGPLHSNGGIRFDGTAYNKVTSAVETYIDNDSDACTTNSWGVHTCVSPADPSPPTPPPARPDVFVSGRAYPVPVMDFNAVTLDLSQLKTEALNDGVYIGKSNKAGWHIQFLGNTTFRYRKVKSTRVCWWWSGKWHTTPVGDIYQYQGNWTTTNLPNNGIIFVEDTAWIDGTLDGNFITLVSAQEPLASGNANIWINNDILYTAKDGTTALGLIAQNDISVGLFSEDDLEINAALLAQKGRVGRHYYPSGCSSTYYKRDTITVYGTIATYERYGFAWVCSGVYCSGYNERNIHYDPHLVFSPPPSFPASGDYTFISWEEILEGESY